jgi:PAS domain S-box-containing protein
MSEYVVPDNEEARLRSLKGYEILDTLSEDEFNRITELASLICDVPISLISLIDENRQWFKAKVGLDLDETPRGLAFCNYAIANNNYFEVEDASKDDRFKTNDLVTGHPDIRFYAGYPLIDANGFALGTLCVIDKMPKLLTPKQKRSLELLAQEVIALIVERRQKEELKNFEKLFKLSNDLICIAGSDGYLKKVNPAFKSLLGWNDNFIKTSFFELIHPDDLQSTRDEIEKLTHGETTINFTHRFKTRSGGYKTLQWVATPEPSAGNLFAIARDVTEEKLKEKQLAAGEERLRVFFENSQGLMCTHDTEGKFLSVNQAGASILGYTTNELLHMGLFDIIPPERHEFLQAYLQAMKTEGQVKGQMVTRHKDGSLKIWMFNNVLEKDSDGNPYVIGNAIDITDKHYLEKDLEHTRLLLEQTNAVARVGGWEFNIEEQKILWTDVTKSIHGVAADYEPQLSTSINFYKEGESRTKITEAVTTAITKGIPYDLELQIITVYGEEIWVRAIGKAEFDNGKCKRIFGTFQDINDKKKAEIEVSKSRKLLDSVLRSASEISIIATDKNGLITLFNSGAEKLLGYNAEEIVGVHSTLLIHLPEEITRRSEELSEQFNERVEGFLVFTKHAELLGSEQREWTYIRKDGSKRTVSLVTTPIRDIDEKINGFLSIATDITEKKRIEQALVTEKARLSAFVTHAPAAVAMFDNQMNYVAVSDRWLEDYHLKGQHIIGLSHYDVFKNLPQERIDRHQRCLNGAVEKQEIDLFHFAGDEGGQYLTVEMRPWYNFDGSIAGMMIFTQNITTLIKQREELKEAKLMAEQGSVAKSEFLANMSHEIRTPLNGVIGFTDLVLKTQLNETQQQYLSIVNQSANALLSIINDILDFSKIEAGKLEFDIEKCDLYELSAQATDIITYQIQKKGLEMLLNITYDLPRFIWVDSVRLKQILINLLSNAAKFTETGEIELKIEDLHSQQGQNTLRFSVRDTGIGIKLEKQHKIFEAFSQEDSSTTKKYGGTGLGLTISNKLLGLMGSRLQLQSKPGEGSTFYFDLTLQAEQGEAINWENIDLIKTALIVDDNDNNRLILKQMLLLKQIESVQAKNGFEALQLLVTGNKYDVILMDYHMPYMDGLETIRKIRESFYTADEQPVVLLYSSSDDEKVISACDELQVSHRLVKPIKTEDIYNTLSRLHIKEEPRVTLMEVKDMQATRQNVAVLIAEDNAVNMLLARTIIKRIAPNALIKEAKNGVEAVDACKTDWPDIILMDIQMPEMNGYEATREIRHMANGKDVPIIALTAGNVKSEKEKCFEAGMDDFVLKPVVEETIAQVFDKWVHYQSEPGIYKGNESKIDEQVHFDINHMKMFIGDDDDLLNEVIGLTKRELTASVMALKIHTQNANLAGLKSVGHKLYGTAATAGLNKLSIQAREFEYMKEFDKAVAEQMLHNTEEEVNLVLTLLHK